MNAYNLLLITYLLITPEKITTTKFSKYFNNAEEWNNCLVLEGAHSINLEIESTPRSTTCSAMTKVVHRVGGIKPRKKLSMLRKGIHL